MKLPRDLTGAEVVKALRRSGFVVMRQRGSHTILRKESRTVVVLQHRPIKPGTLKGVIAGWTDGGGVSRPSSPVASHGNCARRFSRAA